jgi:hypothetical protein
MGYIKVETSSPGNSSAKRAVSGLVLLNSQVGSGAQFITFASIISAAYDNYLLYYSGVNASVSGQLYVQYSNDNGSTWSTNYQSGANSSLYNSATINNNNSTSTALITSNSGPTSNTSGRLFLLTMSINPFLVGNFNSIVPGTGILRTGYNGSRFPGTPGVNAFRIGVAGGANITSGRFSLYGMVQ